MSKRSATYDTWQVWRCPPGVQRHAQPVGAPVRGYDAAGRCQCAGRGRAEWQETRIAMPSRDWRGEILCLLVDFIHGPLLVSFFSITVHHLTMEEKAHANHSDPQRA